MKNYVISLASRPDRLAQFNAINAPFLDQITVFPATDKNDVSKQACIDAGIVLNDADYDDTALAVAMSHLRLWQLCRDIGEPIMVMEDDVHLSPDFWKDREKALTTNPDYDFLALGFNTDWPLEVAFVPGSMKATIIFDEEQPKFSQGHAFCYPQLSAFAGCCCYVITPPCAKFFMENIFPIKDGYYALRYFTSPVCREFTRIRWTNVGIDVAISMVLQDVRSYVCLPPIAIPGNDWSSSSFERGGHLISL
ncbi:glycosyltransferase family 25 protein [Gluconobacter cerinus]|uniref:glycosyltransferase family 25 protein n=1 Tax=Gluconobacter cerinus TaxID=38307 RepID=UPI003AB1CB2C